MKVAVVGSGIGGLAVACRLAAKGYQVTVFEKNNKPGGKISELKQNGYRFDTGPSLFTLPELVDELFKDLGEESNKFSYKKLEVLCKYFYQDGVELVAYADKEKFKQECKDKLGEDPRNLDKYFKLAARIYKITADIFIFNSLHKLKNLLKFSVLKSALQVHKIKSYRTMHAENKRLFKSSHLIQMFDRYATYNGSNPYLAPATLNVIGHLENNLGAYFPKGGMYSIITNIYQLAVRKGVEFKFDCYVEEILTKKNVATGIKVQGKPLQFDKVIINTDVKYFANNIFKEHPLKKRLNKMEPTTSVMVFFWGMKKQFPNLDLHNILFSNSYKEEFNKLFVDKELHDDPTVYIYVSAKENKEDAPANCENWFVLINAPSGLKNWDELKTKARKNIVSKINRTLNISVEDYIEFEKSATPQAMEVNSLSDGGALYGNSSNSQFAAFLRHPNFIKGVKNMYFTGGSVHPGGGIPLCLASARIVDKEIPKLTNE